MRAHHTLDGPWSKAAADSRERSRCRQGGAQSDLLVHLVHGGRVHGGRVAAAGHPSAPGIAAATTTTVSRPGVLACAQDNQGQTSLALHNKKMTFSTKISRDNALGARRPDPGALIGSWHNGHCDTSSANFSSGQHAYSHAFPHRPEAVFTSANVPP